ncbi:MAG: hypothetical protein ACXAB4_11665 [Candidatus Hodarchaeales archaeon]
MDNSSVVPWLIAILLAELILSAFVLSSKFEDFFLVAIPTTLILLFLMNLVEAYFEMRALDGPRRQN